MTGAIIHITLLLTALAVADAGAPPRGAGGASGAADAGGTGRAGSPGKVSARPEVESALGKAGVADLQRLAATAQVSLMAIASDRSSSEMIRARALSALAYARNLKAQTFLENFIVGRTPPLDPTDRVLLRHAAVALGWQGDTRLVEIVGPLLDDADVEVRMDAAVALGLARTRSAEAPLRARLATETDVGVRRQLEASLKAVTASR
jgi:HEAT repeat protein